MTDVTLWAADPATGRRWLVAAIAAYTGLEWSTIWPGGDDQATWRTSKPPNYQHPALQPGRQVTITIGASPIWAGILTEPTPDDDGWTFTAHGLHQAGRDYLCLDTNGDATATPDTAIDRAISDGCPWTRPTTLSAATFGETDDTKNLNRLGDLLDAWADAEGKRWAVHPDGTVHAATDPTTPTWHMTPGSGEVGLTGDDYATDLYIRYQTSALNYATEHVADTAARTRWGRRVEEPIDATLRGLMTQQDAADLADHLITLGKPRLAWTKPVEPASRQLTRGGIPAALPLVRAGQMVRLHGIRDEVANTAWTDFVIGKTRYSDRADSIVLEPVGMAARSIRDVLAKAVAS